jgi:hypothetical protein
LELLPQKPATRLLYQASKTAYPLFALPCDVDIPFAPHGFQRVSAARRLRIWALFINALEDQNRMEEVIKIEQELIDCYGDCLAEKGVLDDIHPHCRSSAIDQPAPLSRRG